MPGMLMVATSDLPQWRIDTDFEAREGFSSWQASTSMTGPCLHASEG